MKQKTPLGNFDLPAEWQDCSTYQFVSQNDPSFDVPLISGRGTKINATRTSVTVAKVAAGNEKALPNVLREQEAQYRNGLPSFTLISRDPKRHPKYGDVHALEYTFELNPSCTVRQVQAFFPIAKDSDDVVCLTLTCDVQAFERSKHELDDLLSSFELPA